MDKLCDMIMTMKPIGTCVTQITLFSQTACSANLKLVGMKYAKDIIALEQLNTIFLRPKDQPEKSF